MKRNLFTTTLKEALKKYVLKEQDEPTISVETPPAPAPSTTEGDITLDQAKQMILATGRANGGRGGFFTVTFIKKDGTERVMNARLDVKKYLKGGELKYDARAMGYIVVYDMKAGGYRMVNSTTITALNIGGRKYTVSENEPGITAAINEYKRMQKLAGINE